MGEETDSGFVPIGDVPESKSAAGEIIEFKMPLSALGMPSELYLRNIRPMTGECCDENWRAIDEIEAVMILRVDEVEYALETAAIPQVCGAEIANPVPIGSFEPAPVQFEQPGFTAEWFVPPGAFNMPGCSNWTGAGSSAPIGTG